MRPKILKLLDNNKLLEQSIYNFSITYCESNNIQPEWENVLFKHVYVTKSIQIKDLITDHPELCNDVHKLVNSHPVDLLTVEECNDDDAEQSTEDGMFKCSSCGSMKTTYYSLQTRSADEPMTNFITCTQCKKRWKN